MRVIWFALVIASLATSASAQTKPAETRPPIGVLTVPQLNEKIAAQQKQIDDLQSQVDQLKKQLAAASRPATSRPTAASPATKPAIDATSSKLDAAVEAALDGSFKELTADGVGLGKTLNFLRSNIGINITINWNELNTVGITENTPVSVSIKNVKASEAIHTVLDTAGPMAKLDYIVKDGILIIGQQGALDTITTVKTYDIKKIVAKSPATTPQKVMDRIQKEVLPETWHQNGGSGLIQILNGSLVVTQSYRGHKALAAFLQQLEKTGP